MSEIELRRPFRLGCGSSAGSCRSAGDSGFGLLLTKSMDCGRLLLHSSEAGVIGDNLGESLRGSFEGKGLVSAGELERERK